MRTDLGIEGLYYASFLEAQIKDQSHEHCGDALCIANNYKEGQVYRLQHAKRFCACEIESYLHDVEKCSCSEPSNIVEVSAQVAAVIWKGAIPLLSLVEED